MTPNQLIGWMEMALLYLYCACVGADTGEKLPTSNGAVEAVTRAMVLRNVDTVVLETWVGRMSSFSLWWPTRKFFG